LDGEEQELDVGRMEPERFLAATLIKIKCVRSRALRDEHAANLAEKGGVGPLVERERPLRRENANGAFVVLANDDNMSDFPLVGAESVMSNLGGAIGAVVAQYVEGFVDADNRSGIQESLENSDGRPTNVKRVGVCNSVCVHFVLEEKQCRVLL
jgi:hypothetical protein